AAAVEVSLRNIARANRWFGGTAALCWGLGRALRGVPAGTRVPLLDVGTGLGDVPRAAAAWGARHGIRLAPFGLERHPVAARLAAASGLPNVVGCAGAPPVSEKGVDVVSVCMVAHHYEPDSVVELFRTCDRLARRAAPPVPAAPPPGRRRRGPAALPGGRRRLVVGLPRARVRSGDDRRRHDVHPARIHARGADAAARGGWRVGLGDAPPRLAAGRVLGTRHGLMRTEDRLFMRAPVARGFQAAGEVERWPDLLNHYRGVRMLERRGDGGIVEMAAWRPFGPLRCPTWWVSEMWVDATRPAVRYRHVRGITAGM